jgi:hypothetical protein
MINTVCSDGDKEEEEGVERVKWVAREEKTQKYHKKQQKRRQNLEIRHGSSSAGACMLPRRHVLDLWNT